MRSAAALAIVLALTAGGCSEHPPTTPPRPAAATGTAQTPTDRVAMIRDRHLLNVELVTHEGRRVRFYDDLVKGKVVAINFMFATCRRACPVATRHLVEVQRALGDRVGRDLDPIVDADRKQHTGLVILGNEPVARWKAISALSKSVRIRQAIERTMLPATQWPTGEAVVNEAPYEESEAGKEFVEPGDLSGLPVRE